MEAAWGSSSQEDKKAVLISKKRTENRSMKVAGQIWSDPRQEPVGSCQSWVWGDPRQEPMGSSQSWALGSEDDESVDSDQSCNMSDCERTSPMVLSLIIEKAAGREQEGPGRCSARKALAMQAWRPESDPSFRVES